MVASNATDSAQKIAAPSDHVCESPDACVDCLASSTLAGEMTQAQVGGLFKIAKIIRLSKGEVLIAQGEFDGPLFVIAKGQFEVARAEAGASRVSLGTLGPGMMVGELAFLGGTKRTATVTSLADAGCVLAIQREDVEAMLRTDPLLVYRVMRAILRSAAMTVHDMNSGFVDSIRYIQG